MAKSLNDFIAATKKGLANTSHFAVFFRTPRVISSQRYSTEEFEKILMFCESATLPGLTYSSSPVRTFGETTDMPYERLFEPVQLTFLVDKNLKVKMFFEEWMAGIQNPYTRKFNYYNDYVSDLEIEMFDNAHNVKYKATLYEAYPKMMSQVDVSNGSAEVMRVTVTFQFKHWTSQSMQNIGEETDGLPGQTILDRIFEVPNKVWNTYVNFQDNYKDLF